MVQYVLKIRLKGKFSYITARLNHREVVQFEMLPIMRKWGEMKRYYNLRGITMTVMYLSSMNVLFLSYALQQKLKQSFNTVLLLYLNTVNMF